MRKKICALLALLLACALTGCGGEGQKSNLTLDQLAVRMALKELDVADAAHYAQVTAEMSEDDFDDFVAKIMLATDKDTDWNLVQKNFAHLGAEMELPEGATEEQSEYFVLKSFSIKRADQTPVHLYFHVYSTWFDTGARDMDLITLSFDPEKLDYVSAYSSDPIAAVSDGGNGGEVVFTYEDRRASDPAPFDGDDRNGEVLVSVRVEPITDGEADHSATLKHDGSKENFEITVEDTVDLF
jgi:hypothetical protein